jgi:hypothetical protein
VRSGAVQDRDLELGHVQLGLGTVPLIGLGERGERGAERLGQRHAVGEPLLEHRGDLLGRAAERHEARLVGDGAGPGDPVDLVGVRGDADLGDHDFDLEGLTGRFAEDRAQRLRVPVRDAARRDVAAVELVAGHVGVRDAGLAQVLVLVVPADRGESDPVVELADLVQHAGRVGRDHQDAARVLQHHGTAAARDALARVVVLVAHYLLGRHVKRHGHRGRFLYLVVGGGGTWLSVGEV